MSQLLKTLAVSGTCGTTGPARLSQAELGRPRPASPHTGCSPTGCHRLSLSPKPAPHSASAGPETALSTPHLRGSPHQGWGACRMATSGTSCSVSSVLTARGGTKQTPQSCRLSLPGNGARSAVGAQEPAQSNPEASSGRAEPLSSEVPLGVKPVSTPGRARGAAESAGAGPRTLVLGSLARLSGTLKMAFEAAHCFPRNLLRSPAGWGRCLAVAGRYPCPCGHCLCGQR